MTLSFISNKKNKKTFPAGMGIEYDSNASTFDVENPMRMRRGHRLEDDFADDEDLENTNINPIANPVVSNDVFIKTAETVEEEEEKKEEEKEEVELEEYFIYGKNVKNNISFFQQGMHL